MAGTEKRQYLRGRCNCTAQVIVDENAKERVRIFVVDLSAGGLKFKAKIANSEYKIGHFYLLKLSVNEPRVDIHDVLTNIKIHRIESVDEKTRSYGASFEDLSEHKRSRIDAFIRHKESRKY